MADRLHIENKVNDNIIPRIETAKLLGLDKENSERIDLFLFAMALGIKQGYRTPLTSKHGFILATSIQSNDLGMALIESLHVSEARAANEDEKIGNQDEAFAVAEEYANTGFHQISKWLDQYNDKDSDELLWDLINQMNERANSIIQ